MEFAVVEANGRTPAGNPQLAAYQYMAHLLSQGRAYRLTVYDYGKGGSEYTVESPGLMAFTFYKGE